MSQPHRIESITLKAVGVFDEFRLDFPPKPESTTPQAELHLLVGGNGCGKSTLLYALAGALYPQNTQPDIGLVKNRFRQADSRVEFSFDGERWHYDTRNAALKMESTVSSGSEGSFGKESTPQESRPNESELGTEEVTVADDLMTQAEQVAENYSLGEQRIPLAKEKFTTALQQARTPKNLLTYAKFLQDNNQFQQAEEFYREGLAIFRRWAQRHPARYHPDVAKTLNNLGNLVKADSQRHAEAEKLYREALDIRRQLAQDNPTVHLHYVANTLNNLGTLVAADPQSHTEAEKLYREALDIRRQLAQENPMVYRPYLAGTLNNLGILVSDDPQRRAETEKLFREALDTSRQLAEDNPTVYSPHVAMALNNMGNLVKADPQRRTEAEKLYREALDIRRQLAQDNPTVYRPYVATTLNNLGNLVSDDPQRRAEAEILYVESLSISRQLAANHPNIYLPTVARTLSNLAELLSADEKRRTETDRLFQELLTIHRQLENVDTLTAHKLDFAQYDPTHPEQVNRFRFTAVAYSGQRGLKSMPLNGIEEVKHNPFEHTLSFNKTVRSDLLPQWLASKRAKVALATMGKDLDYAEQCGRNLKRLADLVREICDWDVEFHLNYKPDLSLVMEVNGEQVDLDGLPDGLKSIISWVTDLSMRLESIPWANPEVDAFSQRIILFLDEIDLHLHPKWQRRVLPAVQKLLPNAQIFASTHSPFVVGSVDNAWIYRLPDPEKGHTKQAGVEPVRSSSGKTFRLLLAELFDIDKEFGEATEHLFKQFYAELENVPHTRDVKKLLEIGVELDKRGAEAGIMVERELRQLSRLMGKEIHRVQTDAE